MRQSGLTYHQCPSKKKKKGPEASIVANKVNDEEASQLCYAWGWVCDHNTLILFDPRSTHNFISVDLAMRMGISKEELGPALEAHGAFKGQEVPVTLL